VDPLSAQGAACRLITVGRFHDADPSFIRVLVSDTALFAGAGMDTGLAPSHLSASSSCLLRSKYGNVDLYPLSTGIITVGEYHTDHSGICNC
jgi:hypothetical protein